MKLKSSLLPFKVKADFSEETLVLFHHVIKVSIEITLGCVTMHLGREDHVWKLSKILGSGELER